MRGHQSELECVGTTKSCIYVQTLPLIGQAQHFSDFQLLVLFHFPWRDDLKETVEAFPPGKLQIFRLGSVSVKVFLFSLCGKKNATNGSKDKRTCWNDRLFFTSARILFDIYSTMKRVQCTKIAADLEQNWSGFCIYGGN